MWAVTADGRSGATRERGCDTERQEVEGLLLVDVHREEKRRWGRGDGRVHRHDTVLTIFLGVGWIVDRGRRARKIGGLGGRHCMRKCWESGLVGLVVRSGRSWLSMN